MDRIVVGRKVRVGSEVLIEGPPLEALRCQGRREGAIVTLMDVEGNEFRGRVTHVSSEGATVFPFD